MIGIRLLGARLRNIFTGYSVVSPCLV